MLRNPCQDITGGGNVFTGSFSKGVTNEACTETHDSGAAGRDQRIEEIRQGQPA
jgi:hypothetical protein